MSKAVPSPCKPRKSDRIKQLPTISYDEGDIHSNYLMCAESFVYKTPNSRILKLEMIEFNVQWEQAIDDEINSLVINNTWTLVQRLDNRNIVDCKWVFTIKNDEFGNPVKYKARLVARGFSQEYLVYYSETFAPIARIASFRFIIAFANQFNLLFSTPYGC